MTPELETARAEEYFRQYLAALPFGAELPETELQPADDLVILAAQAYVTLWKLTGSEDHLFSASSRGISIAVSGSDSDIESIAFLGTIWATVAPCSLVSRDPCPEST